MKSIALTQRRVQESFQNSNKFIEENENLHFTTGQVQEGPIRIPDAHSHEVNFLAMHKWINAFLMFANSGIQVIVF